LQNYVVLRNEEDLFGNVERGGDIDLLVGDAELAERLLIQHLGPPIRINDTRLREGISSIGDTSTWCKQSNGRVPVICERSNSRGSATLGERRPCAEDRARGRNLLVDQSALGRLLQEAIRTGDSSGRGDRWSGIEQALKEAAGNKWGPRLWRAADDGCARDFRDIGFSLCEGPSGGERASARRYVPFRAYLAFVIAELRRRFAPPVPWIAIVGSDSSGKTSLANEIVHRLAVCP
jgi:hypothetical protein